MKLCEVVVEKYRDELSQVGINLAKDVTEEYVTILIQDLQKISLFLRDYKEDRKKTINVRRVKKKNIDPALRAAILANDLFEYFEESSSNKKYNETKNRVAELGKCIDKLNKAYSYLKTI